MEVWLEHNGSLARRKIRRTAPVQAAASMAEVVRQEPGYARPQIIWSDALTQLGDINGAIAHLRLAAQLEPEDATVQAELAKRLAQLKSGVGDAASLQGSR